MADVITRFKLETTQYDSKLRNASRELAEFARRGTMAGNEFQKFTQSQVEVARSLGSMSVSATNAKDKVKELVGSYNDLARTYNTLTAEQQKSDLGKAMAESMTQLRQRIREAKQELQSLSSSISGDGGLFGGGKLGGMLQVFGGNLMTKAAGVGFGLVNELRESVQQGIELAKQGEGIRIAFERLGRGDILDGLRQATHGTVTDLELMKAAVKFNDFKLPVEELGTMLAFAQQKAKDTGQSVDYMVDSIVTGLGRKSLMILDNLGLSAAEIKGKMKETGDMTKAVGAIIREQMSKAGEYVETAADRATAANVSLQNKMEELGRKFAPIEEASNQLWTSIKIGILDIVGGPLATLLNGLTEAGRLRNALIGLNGGSGNTQVDQALKLLNQYTGGGKGIEGKRELYNRQVAKWQEQESNNWRTYNKYKEAFESEREKGGNSSALQSYYSLMTKAENNAKALEIMIGQYQQGAKSILEPAADNNKPIPVEIKNTKSTKELDIAFDTNKAALGATHGVDTMPSVWSALDDEGLRKMLGIGKQQTDFGKVIKQYITDPDKGKHKQDEKNQSNMLEGITAMNTSLQNIFGGIQQLGFEVPEELMNILSVMQTIVGIITAIQTLSTVSLLPFANGGVVHAANGWVGGNSMSGDRVPAMLNSGELVLNRAQVGNLASQLSGGMGQMQMEAVVKGEDLRFILNSNGRRTGRGEIVTTNFR